MKLDYSDTICAIATASGSGAIAVIRISGEKAFEVIDGVFSKPLSSEKSHTAHYGFIKDGDKTIDEVIVTIFKNPHSYTGEDSIEISCHGSVFIQQKIVELLVRKGARLAKPGEFSMRAFLNGKMDLSQTEAVNDLINTMSDASHEQALKQLRGGFTKELAVLREELVNFASLIELELDFSEEDVEFADRDKFQELVNKIHQKLTRLVESFKYGNVIKNGVTTVLAGRPNAGKSTLLNALLNEERAIVSDIAGTTRDVIEEGLNIKGIHYRLIDTAGIREAGDQIEEIGIKKTYEKVASSAILIYVYSVLETLPPEVKKDIEKLKRDDLKIILVGNKMDELYGLHDNLHANFMKRYDEEGWSDIYKEFRAQGMIDIYLSAKKNEVEELTNKLYELVSVSGEGDGTIVTNLRHYEALEKAQEAIENVNLGLESGITGDFLAIDIRQALHYLGEITGEVTTDDLLGNIFSRFCIGK